jgi:hypothetical protein
MLVKKLYLFTVSTLSFLICTAQNVVSDTSATAVAYWKQGEKKTFTLQKKTEKKSKDKFQKDSSSFKLTVSILEETDKSYTIEWLYGAIRLPKVINNDFPGIEALCNNLRIVYKTDETGSFTEVVNTEEVVAFIGKSLEMLMRTQKFTPETEAVLNEFKRTISSKESIENLILKDVQLFHHVFGMEFNKRKQTESGELVNVFGGEPYPSRTDYQFTGFDKNTKLIRININTNVDGEAATRIIIQFMNETAKKMGSTETIKPGDIPTLTIRDAYRFSLDQPTGWIRTASSVRLVDAMGTYKKETTLITLN